MIKTAIGVGRENKKQAVWVYVETNTDTHPCSVSIQYIKEKTFFGYQSAICFPIKRVVSQATELSLMLMITIPKCLWTTPLKSPQTSVYFLL